jgi:hypothetical protein
MKTFLRWMLVYCSIGFLWVAVISFLRWEVYKFDIFNNGKIDVQIFFVYVLIVGTYTNISIELMKKINSKKKI